MDSNFENLAAVAVKKIQQKNPGVDTAHATTVVRDSLQKLQQRVRKTAKINPGKARLASVLDLLDPNESAAIKKGQRQWDYQTIYRRTQIASFGNDVNIWDDASSDRINGQCNINKNVMPAGSNMLMENLGIRWGYDPSGSITDPTKINYYGFKDAPAGFINSEITISVNSVEIIQRLPLSLVMASESNSSQNSTHLSTHTWPINKDFAVWLSNQRIEVRMHTPPGSTMPAGNHFIEVMFTGTTVRSK